MSPSIKKILSVPSFFRYLASISLLVSEFGCFVRHGALLRILAQRLELDLKLATFFKPVYVINSHSCTISNYKHSMMLLRHHSHILIFRLCEGLSHSLAFIEAVSKTVELSIVDNRLVESGMILVDHLELIGILRTGHGRSKSLVGMENRFAPGTP